MGGKGGRTDGELLIIHKMGCRLCKSQIITIIIIIIIIIIINNNNTFFCLSGFLASCVYKRSIVWGSVPSSREGEIELSACQSVIMSLSSNRCMKGYSQTSFFLFRKNSTKCKNSMVDLHHTSHS